MNTENRDHLISLYRDLVLKEVGGGGVCENCGAKVAHRSDMINTNSVSYVFNGQVGSPGHAALPYLMCPLAPNGEHWACSPSCWEILSHDCITNHQRPLLDAFAEKLKNGDISL